MFILKNGPWGQKPKNENSNRPSGQNRPDDVFQMTKEHFKKHRKGGGGGNGGNPFDGQMPPLPKNFLGLLFIVLLALWLSTGFYRVQPEENAVILTFGKMTHTRGESGLGYHIPYPIQEVSKVNVGFDRRLEVGFRETMGDAGSSIKEESMMLTGDENIIDINFIVLYRISNAGNYLFKIREPEATVKKSAESAMREVIGQTEIQKALTEARSEIEANTKILMQSILDDYEAGITINSVQLLRVDPPAEVVDAFDDVQRARTDLERLKNEAETYRNDILPKARGEVQKMLQGAQAYKESILSKAQGEADRFNSVYMAYTKSREVTQQRMYLETLENILSKSNKFIVGDNNGVPVLPYMQLDKNASVKNTAPQK